MTFNDIEDCSMFGIPLPAFILGLMWIEGTIWITRQFLIAHAQLHQGDENGE